ncbi:unnamed protein product [Bursaphelenchus xylophilus]|uniref:nicotinamidase n=1 Tax=Bursaphelenchus xylophilus TaxID=6326 RepID=A0A7I8WVQ8_BURXY|nr:unnamed protein product [Bursaphelenchus xylophilus]CAG9117954.1 unnamed protein product [Bursaphelenchus xylophilus]
MTSASPISPLKTDGDFKQFKDFLLGNLISNGKPDEKSLKQLFQVFDKDNDGLLNSAETAVFNGKIVDKVNNLRTAYMIVDLQNDFLHEAGVMPVKECPPKEDPLKLVPTINKISDRSADFDLTVFTIEWHPPNHISFVEHAHDSDRVLADPSKKVEFHSIVEFASPKVSIPVLPKHCVQWSWGADIHASVKRPVGSVTVPKAYHVLVETHSGFGLEGFERTDLEDVLRAKNIDAIFMCGIAGDMCVPDTAFDAVKLGFEVAILEDLLSNVDFDMTKTARAQMDSVDVAYVHSNAAFEYVNKRKVPFQWIKHFAGIKA